MKATVKITTFLRLLFVFNLSGFRQSESIIGQNPFVRSGSFYGTCLLQHNCGDDSNIFAVVNNVCKILVRTKIILRGGSETLEIKTSSVVIDHRKLENATDSNLSELGLSDRLKNEVMTADLDTIAFLEAECARGNLHAENLLKICNTSAFDCSNQSDGAVALQLFARGTEKGNPVAAMLLGQVCLWRVFPDRSSNPNARTRTVLL